MEVTKSYFQVLVETSRDAIVVLDDKGKVTYQTPSAERISGYSLEEVQGINGLDLIHPDDRGDDQALFIEFANNPGAILHQKHRLKHKHGHYIWIEGAYRNLLHDENIRAIIYNYTDITARESSEQKLKERIKELSTIYNVNSILQDDNLGIDEALIKIVNILPKGWQYPDICQARIVFDTNELFTPNYAPSPYAQQAAILTEDGRSGIIEVAYTRETAIEDEGPFLSEERELINTLANTIEVYFNKKANQEALAKSEANFRGAFEHAGIGMVLVSLTGEWLKVNKELCNIVGYSEEELLTLTMQQITHPEDIDASLEYRKQILDGERDFYHMEKRYLRKDGSVIWINVHVSLVKDNNLVPLYFVSQVEDITHRKEMSDQLKESATLLQMFVAHSPAALAMFDTDMKYIQVSKRWIADYNLWGIDVIGKSHYEVFPTVPQHWKDIHQRCMSGAIERNDEDSFMREDGGLEWLQWEIHPWRRASGEIGGIIMFTEVITERKAVFNELLKSEANLKSIFDTTHVSYMLLDEEFRVIASNQYFIKGYEDQTGIKLEIGKSFIEMTLPGKREAIRKAYESVLATSVPVEYETIYTKDGVTKYYTVAVNPVTSNGKTIGLCVAGTDVTNRKSIELERQKIINDLVQRNRDLEQFAHIVSHNIRGPLSTILGLNKMLMEDVPEQEKAFIHEGINVSAEKLDSVIKDLNEILQTRRELSELKVKVSLQNVVEDIKGSIMLLIKEKGVSINCDFTAVGELLTVRSYINSIFYNLITNGIKFAKTDTPPVITIWTEMENGKIIINFKDNGVGVDLKNYGDRIFTIYSRFHNNVEGKGMGLFMTKTQVEVLNGTIAISSKPGEGALFKVTFNE